MLRLKKTFQTPTFCGVDVHGHARHHARGASSGAFDWHTNPSTRPLVAKTSGRPPKGDPSAPIAFASRGGTTPCANFDTPPPDCYEDHLIKVPSGTGIDNAKATFRVEWPTPVSDYDMKVYSADAAGKATGDPVATSGNGATSGVLGYEEAAVLDPVGSYVVRVINYAGVEPWTGKVTLRGPAAGPGRSAGDLHALLRAARGRGPLGAPGVRGQGAEAHVRPPRTTAR